MSTEVTKLISVSLGKITQSRQAKSGPNLRKSLLVATVLQKARTAYVTEYRIKRACGDDEQKTLKRKFVSQNSVVEGTNMSNQDNCTNEMDNSEVSQGSSDNSDFEKTQEESSARIQQDTDNMTVDVLDMLSNSNSHEHNNIVSQHCDDNQSNHCNKENSPPVEQSHTHQRTESYTKTCLKRKSEGDSSTLTLSDVQPKKRCRLDSRDRCSVSESDSSCGYNSYHGIHYSLNSPMDQTTQINSLVQIFSASFTDLTESKEESSMCSSQSTELFSLCRDAIALTA